jgi:hypothetical protein
MKPTLLVLAAGMGSRYGGLKQIDAVGPNGETIIDYSIYDALRAGFGRLVFVIRKDIEAQFREIVGARFEQRIPVEYVFQELDKLPVGFAVPAGRTKPWGTTHAIFMAANPTACSRNSCNPARPTARWWDSFCATRFRSSAASRAGFARWTRRMN